MDIFYRGKSTDFVQKSYFFLSAFLTEIIWEKIVFLILWKEKNDYKRKKIEVLKRAKKWTFFKGVSPWILSKNRTFSYRRFSQKSYKKKRFWYCGKKGMISSGTKTKVVKRAKKWTFFKGVSPRFCPKIKISITALFHWNYARKDRFSTFKKKKEWF